MSEAGKRGGASWATSGAWVIYSLNLFVFLPLRVVVSLPIPSNDMPGTAFFLAQQTDEVCPLLQQEIKQGPPRAQTWVEVEARDKPPVSWPLGQGWALSPVPPRAALYNHVSLGSGRAELVGGDARLPCQLQFAL